MVSARQSGPRYPELRVSIRSSKPLALVAGVREELRRAGAAREEIASFTEQALTPPDDPGHALEVARDWIGVVEAAVIREPD
jgi:hypothetical protein